MVKATGSLRKDDASGLGIVKGTGQEHGGDIWGAANRWGRAPEEIIDFSANINPLGQPPGLMEKLEEALRQVGHYPPPHNEELRQLVARFMGARPEEIVVGNGAAQLLYLLMLAVRPFRVLLFEPTFSEYRQAALAAGAEVVCKYTTAAWGFRLEPVIESLAPGEWENIDMAVICNPNNPTGVLTDLDCLQSLREKLPKKALLVVDEAFLDFTGVRSNSTDRDYEQLESCYFRGSGQGEATSGRPGSAVQLGIEDQQIAVLTSFTKIFAIPGLRLGALVVPQDIVQRVRVLQPPWSINRLAEVAGLHALRAPAAFIAATVDFVRSERKCLEEGIRRLRHFTVFPGSANFLLVRVEGKQLTGEKVADALAARNILVRRCGSFPGLNERYLRFAVRSRWENELLLDALASCGPPLKG